MIGALGWIVECTRPDLAAEVAVLQRCRGDTGVRDLEIANTILKKAKEREDAKIIFSRLTLGLTPR